MRRLVNLFYKFWVLLLGERSLVSCQHFHRTTYQEFYLSNFEWPWFLFYLRRGASFVSSVCSCDPNFCLLIFRCAYLRFPFSNFMLPSFFIIDFRRPESSYISLVSLIDLGIYSYLSNLEQASFFISILDGLIPISVTNYFCSSCLSLLLYGLILDFYL